MQCLMVNMRVVQHCFRWDASNVEAGSSERTSLLNACCLVAKLAGLDGYRTGDGVSNMVYYSVHSCASLLGPVLCTTSKSWQAETGRAGTAIEKVKLRQLTSNVSTWTTADDYDVVWVRLSSVAS